MSRMRSISPDLIVVAAYGKILRKELLDMPRFGCLNVHGSLLPAYRGSSPINWAIINGEPRTGVTIMRMDEGLDTGPILLSRAIDIGCIRRTARSIGAFPRQSWLIASAALTLGPALSRCCRARS